MKKQEWIKSITDIELADNLQEPFLRMKINEKWATVPQKQNFTAMLNGCVCISGDFLNLEPKDRFYFSEVMPEIEIILFDDMGNEINRKHVAGFTNDHRIVQLWIDTFGQELGREVREGLIKLGYKVQTIDKT